MTPILIRKPRFKTGLVLGLALIPLVCPDGAFAHGHGGGGGFGHGGGGCYHGGGWGRGYGYYPFVGGIGLGLGLGYAAGYYPGWYGGYPYYPYPYPYAAYPPPGPYYAAAGAPAQAPAAPVSVTVHVPADADVWFNGVKTQQKGPTRQFMGPPVQAGQDYQYEVRAVWEKDGQPFKGSRTLTVHAGERIDVDFVTAATDASAVVQQAPAPRVAAPANIAPLDRAATLIRSNASPEQAERIAQDLKLLSDPDEHEREKAAMNLGRMGAGNAIDSLAAALAGDSSAAVRDAAARALGLIADRRSLPALIRAAQADDNREVRHSAQFAVEIIRSRLR